MSDLRSHLRSVLARELETMRQRSGGAYLAGMKKHSTKRASRKHSTKRASRKHSTKRALSKHMSVDKLVAMGLKRHSTKRLSTKSMSRKHSKRYGSALVPHHYHAYHAIGSAMLAGKKKSTHKRKPRGNSTALMKINALIPKYLKEGMSYREAQKEASADYRAMKSGGVRKQSRRHSRKHRSSRY